MPTQTDQQRQAALSAAGVSQSALPTTPSPISVTGLNTPQVPVNVQSPTVVPVPALPPLQAAPVSPAPTQAPTDFTTQLQGLLGQQSGKALDTAATIATATAPYEAQLNSINTQIAQRQAQALAHQEAALRSGETTGYASREAQNVQRTDAIQLLGLQALQAGLQGNIALAEQHAQTAVDIKYGQIEKDIETAKTNIYNNYDSFTPEQKKRADATLLRMDANDAFVKNQKENEKTIYAMAVAASKNFPDDPAAQYAIQKAMQSNDLQTAFNLIGKYQADPVALQTAITEQKLKAEQLRQAPLAFATDQAVAAANIEQSKAATAASRANTANIEAQTAAIGSGNSNISATTGKPLTEAERKAQGYAERAIAADAITKSLENDFTGADQYFKQLLPNILKSSDRQKLEQAQRDFVNAILRPESGAVINPEEFTNARQQYFAQPGDSADVVAQKQANRQTKIASLRLEGGLSPASGETQIVNGITYVRQADGLYYPQ